VKNNDVTRCEKYTVQYLIAHKQISATMASFCHFLPAPVPC